MVILIDIFGAFEIQTLKFIQNTFGKGYLLGVQTFA